MDLVKLRNKAMKFMPNERICMIAYFLCYFYCFVSTTMYGEKIPHIVFSAFLLGALIVLSVVAGLRVLLGSSLRQIGIIAVMAMVILISTATASSITLVIYFLAILAVRDIPTEKIARLTFWTNVILGVLTVFSSLVGIVENLTYYRILDDAAYVRMSLGFVYPTDFAAHIFFTLLLFFYLKGGRLNWRNQLCYAAAAWFVSAVCNARLSTAMIVMIMVVSVLYTRLVQGGELVKTWLRWPLILAAPVCASVNFLLIGCYRDCWFMNMLDVALSHRLSIGAWMFLKRGFKVFGQYIEQNGNGGTVESLSDRGMLYTFLDMSYQRILMVYGLVLFLLLMGIIVWRSGYFANKHTYLLLVIMLMISLASIVEHHFLDFSYNVFLIYLFSEPELTAIEERRVLPRRFSSRFRESGEQSPE